MKNDKPQDADKLRAKLDEIGLGQCGAARALGIDPRTMRRYCSGKWKVPRTVWLSLDALHFVGVGRSSVVRDALEDAAP